MSEINKIRKALQRQRNRTASIEDINFLIKKESQYGTLNPMIINQIIR